MNIFHGCVLCRGQRFWLCVDVTALMQSNSACASDRMGSRHWEYCHNCKLQSQPLPQRTGWPDSTKQLRAALSAVLTSGRAEPALKKAKHSSNPAQGCSSCTSTSRSPRSEPFCSSAPSPAEAQGWTGTPGCGSLQQAAHFFGLNFCLTCTGCGCWCRTGCSCSFCSTTDLSSRCRERAALFFSVLLRWTTEHELKLSRSWDSERAGKWPQLRAMLTPGPLGPATAHSPADTCELGSAM